MLRLLVHGRPQHFNGTLKAEHALRLRWMSSRAQRRRRSRLGPLSGVMRKSDFEPSGPLLIQLNVRDGNRTPACRLLLASPIWGGHVGGTMAMKWILVVLIGGVTPIQTDLQF